MIKNSFKIAFAFAFVFSILSSCNKDNSDEVALLEVAPLERNEVPSQLLDSIDMEKGIVQYNKDLSAWTIIVYENGTIDSVSIYIPKSLDKAFQKNGLPITVSGSVYKLSDTFLSSISQLEGYKYYALDITSISEDSLKTNDLIGTWSLLKADYHFGGVKTFSPDEYVYRFYNNGILVVQDLKDGAGSATSIFMCAGTHQYNLTPENQEITIDSSTAWYRFDNGNLIIDCGSAWDAPVFVFQKNEYKL